MVREGCTTVVSRGDMCRAMSMPSKPVTETSSGTLRPMRLRDAMTVMARRSFETTMALGACAPKAAERSTSSAASMKSTSRAGRGGSPAAAIASR